MIFRTTRCVSLPRPAEQLNWSLLISYWVLGQVTNSIFPGFVFKEKWTVLRDDYCLNCEFISRNRNPQMLISCTDWFPFNLRVIQSALMSPCIRQVTFNSADTCFMESLLMRIRLMCSNRSFRQPLFFQYVQSLIATIGVYVNRCSFSTFGH